MIFPQMGRANPEGETGVRHGGTETRSGMDLFTAFSVSLRL